MDPKLKIHFRDYATFSQEQDGEIKIVALFKEVLPKIEKLASFTSGINTVDSSMQLIAKEYEFSEFFSNSWTKLRQNLTKINNFYQTFENIVKKKVYVDEVTINDFIESHKSSEILENIQTIVVPTMRMKGIFYKLYLALNDTVNISY